MRAHAKRKKKKADLRQVAFTRFMFIIAFFILWISGIGARLVYLQVNMHEELREKAVGNRTQIKKQRQLRGTIFDRNERALAISVRVKTLYADPTKLEDIPDTAKKLANLLKVNEKQLRADLTEGKELEKKFVPIAKGLDDIQVDELNKKLETPKLSKADLPKYAGLHWREDQRRSYPQGTLAAHLVGFSNADGVGQAGIEQSQNEHLHGAVIKRVQERDRFGRVYDELVSEQEEPKNIVLTIDTSVQYHVERALQKAVRQSNAKSGSAIVIDNRTGEILGMANYPTYDPNDLRGITAANLTNTSIQNMYSPGSVFKLITYGAAMEKRLISPDAFIDTGNGAIEVAKHRFKDSRALGSVTYSKAMAVSSNVGAIRTALRLGKEDFHSSVVKFGFGSPTGIELPAEAKGIVRPPARWFGDSLASMAIGYEIGVSALQMATAFATIANDGVKVQPHLIKEIRQADETIVSVTRPEKTQVVSVETARGLRRMLREVVESGTGKKAHVEGYSIAGKTGTAWKFDEKLKRVNSAKYISSFIGFAPADDPAVTIAIMIDEPKNGGRDGGSAAAPVFSEIATEILPLLKVAPDGTIAEQTETEEIPESVGDGDANASALAPLNEGSDAPRTEDATLPNRKQDAGRGSAAKQAKAAPVAPEKRTSQDIKSSKAKPPKTAEARKRIEATNRN
ncbi:MAG: penicillin-binding protein 2 [Pyrinomonadaceae bacterium]|nr:penicillin-binding protein 2 [Pyrinomonadaceae bacterium]